MNGQGDRTFGRELFVDLEFGRLKALDKGPLLGAVLVVAAESEFQIFEKLFDFGPVAGDFIFLGEDRSLPPGLGQGRRTGHDK